MFDVLPPRSYFHCDQIQMHMEAVAPQVMHMTHWVSVKEYAKASGIEVRSAYMRIKRQVVSHVEVAGTQVIDIRLSPPARNLRKDAPKAPRVIWPSQLPPAKELVAAWDYCEQHKMRGHGFYRAMLLGQVPGWIIADILFVERSLDPAPFKRKAAPLKRKRRYTR